MASTYWLTRIVWCRVAGALYLLAFLIALHQNEALMGAQGLTPVCAPLAETRRAMHWDASSWAAMWGALKVHPTLFLAHCDDEALRAAAAAGAALAAFVTIAGAANVLIWLTLAALQLSFVNLGSTWYSFGWETQLIETGVWMAASSPWLSLARLPAGAPVSPATPLLYRWLLFKIMLGAGLIKLRGDACWRDFGAGGCMNWHYETQPNPHVLSRWFHLTPPWFHAVELGANHAAELVAPWLLWGPRRARIAGGLAIAAFMGTIALSGNLAFLNHLTAAPAVWVLDDACWAWAFPRATLEAARAAEADKDSPRTAGLAASALDWVLQRLYGRTTAGGGVQRPSSAATLHVPPPPAAPEPAAVDTSDGADSTPTPSAAASLRRRRGGKSGEQQLAAGAAADAATTAANGAHASPPAAAAAAAAAGHAEWRPVSSAAAFLRRRGRPAWASLVLLAAALLNVPVVRNLASDRQAMNRSFDAWHVANTYGAFGSVHSTRTELVVQGSAFPDAPSRPAAATADGDGGTTWREYEFVCKPGAVSRRPCTITPYHLRLDWLAWFAGSFGGYQQYPWTASLVHRLLSPRVSRRLKLAKAPKTTKGAAAADGALHHRVTRWAARVARRGWRALNRRLLDRVAARDVRDLLAFDPFANGTAAAATGASSDAPLPAWVRVEKYEYRWTPRAVRRLADVVEARARAAAGVARGVAGWPVGGVRVELDEATDVCGALPPAWGWAPPDPAQPTGTPGMRLRTPGCAAAVVVASDDGSGLALRLHPAHRYGGMLEVGAWWCRRRVGEYLPPLEAGNPSLAQFLASMGWGEGGGLTVFAE
jgi:hypothetical protein